MKKTYIIPTVLITTVQTETLMVTSVDGFNSNLDTDGGNGTDILVKGDNQSYNVWDDDWSK